MRKTTHSGLDAAFNTMENTQIEEAKSEEMAEIVAGSQESAAREAEAKLKKGKKRKVEESAGDASPDEIPVYFKVGRKSYDLERLEQRIRDVFSVAGRAKVLAKTHSLGVDLREMDGSTVTYIPGKVAHALAKSELISKETAKKIAALEQLEKALETLLSE